MKVKIKIRTRIVVFYTSAIVFFIADIKSIKSFQTRPISNNLSSLSILRAVNAPLPHYS